MLTYNSFRLLRREIVVGRMPLPAIEGYRWIYSHAVEKSQQALGCSFQSAFKCTIELKAFGVQSRPILVFHVVEIHNSKTLDLTQAQQ